MKSYLGKKVRVISFLLTFIFLMGITLKFTFNVTAFAIEDLNITLTPETEVLQGGKIEIKAAAVPSGNVLEVLDASNFTIAVDGNHTVSKYDKATKSFSINGKASQATLTFTYTDAENIAHTTQKKIEVKSVLDKATVTVLDATSNEKIEFGSEIKMLSGETKSIKVSAKDLNGDTINVKATLGTEKPDVIKFNDEGLKTVTITGSEQAKLVAQLVQEEQTAKIAVGDAGSFTVKVIDKIQSSSIQLYDSNNFRLSGEASTPIEIKGQPLSMRFALAGASGKDYNPDKIPGGKVSVKSSNEDLVKANFSGNVLTLTPQSLPPRKLSDDQLKATITVEALQADKSSATKAFHIKIVQLTRSLTFSENPVVLPKDSNRTVTATVKNISDGAEDTGAVVIWELVKDTDSKWIMLTKQGKQATVIWKSGNSAEEKDRPSFIEIRAKATDSSGQTLSENIIVKMFEIDNFAKLKVKMNVLDRRTVRDLFGSVTDEEYYVVSVRMYNNLKDDKTDQYIGASILVYNGSFEVGVLLQKQYDKDSKSFKREDAKRNPQPNPTPMKDNLDSYRNPSLWFDVDEDDFDNIVSDFEYVYNKDDKGRNITTRQVPFGESAPCTEVFTYRPLTFEMAVNTVDPRDSRRFRSRVFAGLNLAGTLASTGSAMNILKGNSVNLILDRYSNLLVPGLEKIFPSLKEVHRQNVVSMGMKPIEEIAFGTDLTRIIFIPKKAIYGVLKDHRVRISQICPFYFKVEVAVIRRGDKTEIQQNGRP